MKNSLLGVILLSLTLFLTVSYVSAQQDVLWYGDPDQNLYQVFRRFDTTGESGRGACGDANHPKPTVTNPRDSRYGKIWRINKPQGRRRAEFSRTSYIPKDGQTIYYGWRWKINSTTPIKNGMAVWQWKTEPGKNRADTQNYPLSLSYNGSNLTLFAFGPGFPDWTEGVTITNRRTQIWTRNVRPNQWVSIVIGLKLSRNRNNGYVEVWFNGQKQTLTNRNFKEYQVKLSSDRKRAYHKTWDGNLVYPKWGAYGPGACPYNINTFYHDMKIGRTARAAMPSGTVVNPPPPNPGGPRGYRFAANEGQTVVVPRRVNIAYGANGRFNYRYNVNRNTPCNNRTFGDPIVGTAKRCYVQDVNRPVTGRINGEYLFKNLATGRYLDSNGALLTTSVNPDGRDKQWNLVYTNNGYYNIDCTFPGRGVIETQSNGSVRTSTVEPRVQGSRNDNREWLPEAVGNNIYRFRNRTNGRRFLAEKTGSHTIEFTNWNGNRSRWQLVKIGGNKALLERDEALSNLTVYPNPAASSFTIMLGADAESHIEISNLSGQKVYETRTTQDQLTLHNTDKFANGVYLVKVKTENSVGITKLIIKK